MATDLNCGPSATLGCESSETTMSMGKKNARQSIRNRRPFDMISTPDRHDQDVGGFCPRYGAPSGARNAEAALVARIDRRQREIDEDVRCAELLVNHRA